MARARWSGSGTEDDPLFFATVDDLRAWLQTHHDGQHEAWVGMHKVGSGIPSVTWPDLVDACLCFGWIDGIRKGIDTTSYRNRITPRRAGSNWSVKNINRIRELIEEGLVTPNGLAAFEARTLERSGDYSFEQGPPPVLDEAYEAVLRANAAASAFFDSRAPWYRRTAAHWVMSAKREETRRRRLQQLIDHSAAGRPIPPLNRPGGR